MDTESTPSDEGGHTTRQLKTGDWVITPDGGRRAMVRRVYPGGVLGDDPGKSTVHFEPSSVQAMNGHVLPCPRTWLTCDDDAGWHVEHRDWWQQQPENIDSLQRPRRRRDPLTRWTAGIPDHRR
ncbi:hypothetical protein [Amycolatopsis sp. lyj-90]|uniref:hypothetical protein n=1 Tax=Amycolatopsis sp. lyj-90 TaxID=2789285 RepID=UPI00397D109E